MEKTKKKKRLGMWNRLAIVGAFLAIFAWPVALAFMSESKLAEYRTSDMQRCKERLIGSGESSHSEAIRTCLDENAKQQDDDLAYVFKEQLPGWMILYALAYAFAYLLILAIVKTCKWVIAGRNQENES
ncbi:MULTISPECIES: hypothetical protein [Stenotrophomonas maltophilia group]|mgnify:CR=1 FL=1|uniref:hypothetical protein n=1 Tax=Stenotrophomonas maltophilia group TaxID=995085 RepID=UPI001122BC27|nr:MULTISPECIES: hypothetical protein [Stenotrophomonas maltophilia group]MDH2038276.1 hypothetical protein [Stenotrophomonas maltophilia]MDT3488702.1 hypothetical protein [Stenotrophomonas maltophilia group sp. msm4]QGL66986.1 hypothetical protein FEO86_06680 [Stenotrophomonas maltophilia]TNY01973.1 hypothetical protein FIU09_01815 [Stenotrophomonas maltophilia]TPD81634.1 hypothetical protein FJN21_00610 [Stenotrophomonas maltophilia]